MNVLDSTIPGHLCPGTHPKGGPCLEPVGPLQERCEICGTEFLWSDNPEAAERKLKLTPVDALGKKLLRRAGESVKIKIVHFSKPAHLRRWNRIVETVPPHQIESELARCFEKNKGYGFIEHALNALDKLIKDGRVEEAPVVDPLREFVP